MGVRRALWLRPTWQGAPRSVWALAAADERNSRRGLFDSSADPPPPECETPTGTVPATCHERSGARTRHVSPPPPATCQPLDPATCHDRAGALAARTRHRAARIIQGGWCGRAVGASGVDTMIISLSYHYHIMDIMNDIIYYIITYHGYHYCITGAGPYTQTVAALRDLAPPDAHLGAEIAPLARAGCLLRALGCLVMIS